MNERGAGGELDREIAVRRPASSELAAMLSNPSSRATRARSIGKVVPASAAAPSGSTFTRRRQSASRPRSRSKHRRIGEQVVAEGDGLRDLQVRGSRASPALHGATPARAAPAQAHPGAG